MLIEHLEPQSGLGDGGPDAIQLRIRADEYADLMGRNPLSASFFQPCGDAAVFPFLGTERPDFGRRSVED